MFYWDVKIVRVVNICWVIILGIGYMFVDVIFIIILEYRYFILEEEVEV